ncbi:HAEPLYID family protein [Flavobacterium caseinilyticum]|uniref:Phosphoribosylformylglycinamidine synthase n=1 Tax=Flavobacterium caseinilyticum TaxID=2541732 RepID=A0A4V2YTH3_9FLAO|nr:HAEPLYID family protein [Flavobacterium caseinilyticum]TDD73777.1 phosphoribosylformylglycinamidine synthase [Flavobacterium caseinilyticum]
MNTHYLETKVWTLVLTLLIVNIAHAQKEKNQSNSIKDSLYIQEVEGKKDRPKVLHAEPLYIDLIRDLGARKGEREWNVGLGLTDNITHDEYTALIEYEWAPIDRLGLEIELPFSIYYPTISDAETPGSSLHSIKLAAQYTFFVSEKKKLSMALGYIHEFQLTDFKNYQSDTFFTGNVYNPFLVVAKRWGQNFHTLLYTGPQFSTRFADNAQETNWQINSNVHYMIPGSRNFIGVEFNKEIKENDFDMTIRPQMRVEVTKKLLIGIVTGIPIKREIQRFSTFLRLIYEPSH